MDLRHTHTWDSQQCLIRPSYGVLVATALIDLAMLCLASLQAWKWKVTETRGTKRRELGVGSAKMLGRSDDQCLLSGLSTFRRVS